MDALNRLGLVARRPVPEDAQATYELYAAVDQHDLGYVDLSAGDVADEMDEMDLAADAWLLHRSDAPHALPIAYAATTNRGNVVHRARVAVHPDWRRRGIGAMLVGWLEARAREQLPLAPDDAEVVIAGWAKGASEPERRWAERLGYHWARQFLRMRIDLAEPPPPPLWPPGITVRTFRLGQDEAAIHEALEDAFSDHWGHVPAPLDDLVARTRKRDFDASLWFMALDGERVVATATNSTFPDDLGWISGLGTVRSHRRRGLARAILLHSFAEFWRRGQRSVALGVDADSLTGATALYESVEMRVDQRFDQFRKVLREGRPVDTREVRGG